MRKQSAGILLYKKAEEQVRVLLVHPGGPFWAKKDLGAWSIPKGEFTEGEESLAAARREFREELGVTVPEGPSHDLGSAKQSNKEVFAWAVEGDLDTARIASNTFEMEWPPRSGSTQEFPEVDKAKWFPLPEARLRIVTGQTPFLERLAAQLGIIISELPVNTTEPIPKQGKLPSKQADVSGNQDQMSLL